MCRAMIVTMLIAGLFSNVSARELEPAEMSEEDPRQFNGTEIHLAAGNQESYAGETYADAAPQTAYQVRLYGRVEFDITHSKNSEGIHRTTYGIWKGSRMGLKGRGDLGAGLKPLFHLESGFGSKDGKIKLMQGGRLFGRQAYLGMESGLGTVTLGRQYPVSDAVAGIADIALPGVLSAYKSQFYWQIDRLDDALMYSSPEMGGFQARLGYAFGKKGGAAGSSTMSTGLLYSAGALTTGVSLESWKTPAFSTSSTVYNFWNLAASYDLGVAALVAGYSSDDVNLDLSSDNAIKSRTYALGATLPAGTAGEVVLLFQSIKPENGTAMDISTLRYTHTLSKRTVLYSQINLANNPAAKAYGPKREFLFGVRYRFDIVLLGN